MAEIRSPRLYRLFQLVACILGPILALVGYFIGSSRELGAGLIGAGLALLAHGLVASLILQVESRRKAK